MPTFSTFLLSLIMTFRVYAVDLSQVRSAVQSRVPWYEVPDLSHFDYLDTKNKIPELAKKKALAYYELYKDKIPNKNYITVFDASNVSGKPRLHLIHIPTGATESYLVAHGKGSDRNHDGYAEKFSNQPNSNATSLGFYITEATYMGDNGYSLRLKGLESTNSNAYARAIVVHGAGYVDAKMAAAQNKVGRSQGCPAVETKYAKSVINKIKNGSVFYIWSQ
ncbi:MAG: hypothetical protein B7Y39_09805 [Bdellovibrio sp. 28-41-41]|nr:MAG: hypothetical protein B7Y39_09805 [Bdellovibrio sp. 28-41-41]